MKNKELIMRRIADIATIILLVCAFGIAYYTGFHSKSLNTTLFALISAMGLAAMFVVGPLSELLSRISRNTVTKSFLGGFIAQLVCVIMMAVFMILGAFNVIPLEVTYIKVLYIVFVLMVVLGYCRSVAYANTVEATLPAEKESEDE